MNRLIFKPEFSVFPSKWYLPLFTPDVPGFNCTVLTRLYLLLGSPECGLSAKHVLEITNWFSYLSESQRIEGIPPPPPPTPPHFIFVTVSLEYKGILTALITEEGQESSEVSQTPLQA